MTSVDSLEPIWPPEDRTTQEYLGLTEHELEMPDSPWVYGNEAFNPALQASNARKRAARKKASAVPPYHPDYDPNAVVHDYSSSSSGYESETLVRPNGQLVRRGSEGLELGPVDREDMLRQYVEGLGAQQGRYNVYVPDPPSEPDTSDDDDIPLGERVERWRAATDPTEAERKNQ